MVALLYVLDVQKLDEYREYFRSFFTHKPVVFAQTLSTREEADRWFTSGIAKDGDLVKIATQGFIVIDALKGLTFVLTRLLEELGSLGSK